MHSLCCSLWDRAFIDSPGKLAAKKKSQAINADRVVDELLPICKCRISMKANILRILKLIQKVNEIASDNAKPPVC